MKKVHAKMPEKRKVGRPAIYALRSLEIGTCLQIEDKKNLLQIISATAKQQKIPVRTQWYTDKKGNKFLRVWKIYEPGDL